MNTDVMRLQRTIGIGGAITALGLLAVGFPLYLSRSPDNTVLGFFSQINVQQFILLLIIFTATAIIRQTIGQTIQVVLILVFGLVGQTSAHAGSFTGFMVAGIGVVLGAHYGFFHRQPRLKIGSIAAAMLLTLLLQSFLVSQADSGRWTLLEFSYHFVGATGLLVAYTLTIRDVALSETSRRARLEREVSNRTTELREEVARRRTAESREAEAAETARHLARERLELLKEVHHRAKNSLQMVLTLLETFDPKSPEDITPTINRVRAIGLVYDLVDAGTDLSSITLEDYLDRLMWHLQMSHADRSLQIVFDQQGSVHRTQLEATVNLGLLVHEIVNVALSESLPRTGGTIRIVEDSKPEVIEFTITHGSRPLPSRMEIREANNGAGLMQALVERLHIEASLIPGTDNTWKLAVPREAIVKSVVQ